MANKEISELTAGAAMDGTELVHGVQGGNSRKFTGLQLLTPTLSAANQAAVRATSSAALKGHLFGLTLANNATDATNDIDIAAGECASGQAEPILLVYAGATGRQLDVTYGTGSGARFDTSISDGTWHAFIISNGTAVGFGLSKSLDPTGQANYPSGYTHYRRIGSIIRSASAILGFTQRSDEFYWAVPAADVSTANPGTSEVGRVLTVPLGIQVHALLGGYISWAASGDGYHRIYSREEPNVAPSISNYTHRTIALNAFNANIGKMSVLTATDGKIYTRHSSSGASDGIAVNTFGYVDKRGKI